MLVASSWTHEYWLGSSADGVFPAIAAYNGRIVVTFYTRAYDPNGIGLDYTYARATGLSGLQNA